MCVAASYLAARLFIMAACEALEDVVHYSRDATARRGNDQRLNIRRPVHSCAVFRDKIRIDSSIKNLQRRMLKKNKIIFLVYFDFSC